MSFKLIGQVIKAGFNSYMEQLQQQQEAEEMRQREMVRCLVEEELASRQQSDQCLMQMADSRWQDVSI